MKTSNMSNLTIFTNNNKAMRDLLLYSIFSECNAYLELIMGCTTQISWNDSRDSREFKLQADCQPVF